MSNVTPSPTDPPTRPTLVPPPPSSTDVLSARVAALEARIAALTPDAVLAGIDAQVAAARGNLAENVKWMELTTVMMSRLRRLFADLSDDETTKVADSLPNAGNLVAALRSASGDGAASSTGAGGASFEDLLTRVLNATGAKL